MSFQNILFVVDIILLAIILVWLIVWLWVRFEAKRMGGELSNQEFKAGMHKAQIIDLRERAPFKRKHIDGARNIPYSMFRYQYSELRADLPVYLYSDSTTLTLRAARFLKKKGFASIHWLKGGFSDWDGRTKASKY